MRREWPAMIKNRRWDEFEKLAKSEPDQLLCDTIAELERGFTEKADRKALKKILWLLEKAGYSPNELEETTDMAPESAVPGPVAFMISSDSRGETPITYGYWDGSRFKWLTAYLHANRGIVRASDETMSAEDAQKRIEILRVSKAIPFISAEVDAAYGLSRLRRAIQKNKSGTLPDTIARWRTYIDKAPELPHPSLALKAAKTKPIERSEDVLLMDSTLGWRIELGAATPILEKLYEAQQANKEADEEAKTAATQAARTEASKEVLSEAIIADQSLRLRDLAWLMHLNGDENVGKVIAAVEELEKKGAASEYGKGLIDKTIVVYFELMKKTESQADQ